MSSSWRDGLAFCALIHRFRPDLINFDALSKNNVYENNQLAFTVAESLGIAALLEAKDMNDLPVPDKLSIITYVASMHNYFKDKEKLGGPGVSSYKEGNIQIGTKRHQDNDPLNTTEPKRSTPDQSEEKIKKIGSSPTRQRSPADDLCALCQKKVYLIEKQIDNGKLYHRSCFRGSHMSPTTLSLEKERSSRKDFSEEKQSRESSPGSPVLMMQVTSRTMEDKQHRASKSVTKSSTSLEAESGKQQVVSGLLKSLANIRQRQDTANTPSPTSSPPPPKTPSGPPHFSKLSTAQSTSSPMPVVTNSLPFSQPLNSLPSTPGQTLLKSTPLLDKTKDVKLLPPTDTHANQKDKSRSVARIKTVITSSPTNPAIPLKTQPLTTELASTTSALSRNSNVTNESASVPDSLTKPKASKKTTEVSPLCFVSSTKTNTTSKNSPSHPASLSKSNVSKVDSQSSSSRSASPKSKVSQISSESSSSRSASPAKSKVSQISSESSSSRSASPAKSKVSQISSESSSSRSASPAKSKVSQISSESSSSHSASPAKAKVSQITSESSSSRSASPAKSKVSKITSESSSSRSASPAKSKVSQIANESSSSQSVSSARSNLSKITAPPLQTDSSAKLTTLVTSSVNTHTTDKLSMTKDNRPQSILERIEQYSKVAAGVEKPLSEQSPKREIILVPTLDMRVNPIPKPKRQKPGLIPNTTRENKENPIESNLSHNNFTNSHKTNGALSERQDTGDTSKTEWQLEAERRMAARKGKYVDPETRITRFVLPDTTTQLENEKNGDGNQNRHGLKKISVTSNLTFNFDDSLNSNTSLDFPYRKQVLPKQDLDSLEWSNPKKQLSTDEIQRELMDIDSKLTDLELRGRQLEVSIRAANEEDEKFMVEWFQLINEKNELIRRENDLIYQSQEQELEEEQIQIDKELQALMQKPYEKKSKAEKRKEEELIQKKINVVNQRNLIVDSIDEDRLRYKEEDEGIKEVLQSKGYLGIEATY
ncbi:MICAL-like protein 2,MICAL-like protein 1 [Acanthosepion pharaonis]|uniref:MICAL-like protein 2,MICAL-like protein 1 n=1 Tax=Acanthosepion pharaonis TaxID=158019 RepID=A0A812ENC4_ACAPH|nr:MICAL-like protein 2,MICAL-like protein 1 [Sepia pharaonis]